MENINIVPLRPENCGEPIPVSEAIKTDPELRALVEKIQSGELSLCSPFPGMDREWSEEEKQSLDEALRKIFRWQ